VKTRKARISHAYMAAAFMFLAQGCHQMKPGPPLRVACIGDSITLAMGGYPQYYPTLLKKKLGDSFEVRNFGYTGTAVLKKADYSYEAMPPFGQSLNYAPELVIIMLGTNDSKPVNWIHKEEFQEDLREMVTRYQKLTDHTRIYVALPCPIFNKEIEQNNQTLENEIIPAIRLVARETGAEIIDVHSVMKDHPEYLYDGLHPNTLGTEAIADEAYKKLKTNR